VPGFPARAEREGRLVAEDEELTDEESSAQYIVGYPGGKDGFVARLASWPPSTTTGSCHRSR
jgi:hypothetical protein